MFCKATERPGLFATGKLSGRGTNFMHFVLPMHLPPPEMIICSDAAKTGGWGAACGAQSTGGTWNMEESALNINIQELMAAELAIKTFTKSMSVKSIHIQIDNTAALSYLVKMGGTRNMIMNVITKRKLVPSAIPIHSYLLN